MSLAGITSKMLRVLVLPVVLPHFISCAAVSLSSADTANEVDKWKAVPNFEGCIVGDQSKMVSCLGIKAVAFLDRASTMSTINLLPGVNLVANAGELHRSGRLLMTEEEIENTIISSNSNEKRSKLMDMLIEFVLKFFNTHSIQLSIPKVKRSELQRALDEGRGKIKKKLLPFLAIVAVKVFALLPLLLAIVGFLALKALLVGKIALIIAGILALQKYSHGHLGNFSSKLMDGYSSSASSYSPVSSPDGGYYRRSIEDQEAIAAQQQVYSAQIPEEEEEGNSVSA